MKNSLFITKLINHLSLRSCILGTILSTLLFAIGLVFTPISALITVPLTTLFAASIVTHKQTYSWKKIPYTQEHHYTTIYNFYKHIHSKNYPNIVFIGKLAGTLDKLNKDDTWLMDFNMALRYSLFQIHQNVHSDQWLPAIEDVLTHPEYAETVAYLANLVENDRYVSKLLMPRSSTNNPRDLENVFRFHLSKINELTTALTIVSKKMDHQLDTENINDMLHLNTVSFNTVYPIRTNNLMSKDPSTTR